MIDLEFLERLIDAIDQSGIDSIEIERGGTRVRLSKTPPAGNASGGAVMYAAPQAPAPAPVAPAPQAAPEPAPPAEPAPGDGAGGGPDRSDLVDITSPMVGTFYRAPAPDAPPYVDEGTRISEGDTLCIIEAMKLMNELEAEMSGEVVEICVDNAEPVEFGQVLFRVRP